MFTEFVFVEKSKRMVNTGFQPQTQTTSITSKLIVIFTEATETILPTEVNEVSTAISLALIPCFKIAQHVPTVTVRSNPVSQNYIIISNLSASKDIPLDSINHEVQFKLTVFEI